MPETEMKAKLYIFLLINHNITRGLCKFFRKVKRAGAIYTTELFTKDRT